MGVTALWQLANLLRPVREIPPLIPYIGGPSVDPNVTVMRLAAIDLREGKGIDPFGLAGWD
jgi:hypothetical protein